jgi:hypothetical protein
LFAATAVEISGAATFNGIFGLVFWSSMLLVTALTLAAMNAAQKRATLAGEARPPVLPMYLLYLIAPALLVGAIFSVVESSDDRKPPPDSVLVWTPEETQSTGPNTLLFSGEITNNSRRWEIFEPRLELKFYDQAQQWVGDEDLELADSPIGPGQTHRYTRSVELAPNFQSHDEALSWEWLKAE